jgi:hypothetical protein
MPFTETESGKDEGDEGYRIDRGQDRSGGDQNTFLRNPKHEIWSSVRA